MISHTLRLVSALLIGLTLLTTGCGGEKVEKVDLSAQLAVLSADGDADNKIAALAEIAKLGNGASSAVDTILPLLKDPDPVMRRTAAFALGSIGPASKAAVPELKAMLQTDDRNQLSAAVNALRAIDPSAVEGVKIKNVME
jgi:HEAT repeat protein